MVAPIQAVHGTGSSTLPVVPIMLEYNPTTYAVSVTPSIVAKGATICFNCSQGSVRVVFVSPFNDDGPQLLDSEPRTLTVGGIYHFRCFFKQTNIQKKLQVRLAEFLMYSRIARKRSVPGTP
jgi:hypothetical protein